MDTPVFLSAFYPTVEDGSLLTGSASGANFFIGDFPMTERYPRYASFKGELCRVIPLPDGGLGAEVWSDGSWVKDPYIGVVDVDFEGHWVSRADAELFLSEGRPF